MHYIPFNSRKDYHRSPTGAVPAGSAMSFRLVLPRCEQCSAVRLLLMQDSGGCSQAGFSWERMEGEGEEWWRLDFTAPQAGLWWYKFEYDTPWGTRTVSRESAGAGVIGEGSFWQLTVYDGESPAPDWLEGGIIYQIFPDRFCRSEGCGEFVGEPGCVLRGDWGGEPMWQPDSRGKINEYDFFGGNLRGIEEKLDYLSSLGVTCIYLNPIFKARSNHRYDTGDYEMIDPLLGGEEDFKSLCSAAKKRGIRIMLDGVFSHTGAYSRYFDRAGEYGGGAYSDPDSKYRAWYKFRAWPDDYESWWGVDILPELNENEPSVLEFFTGEDGIVRRWLRAGADAWRLDVADELPDKFLDLLHEAAREEKSDAVILGEVWEDASNKTSYGVRRRYLLGQQLDSVMNYPFAQAILNFVRSRDAEGLCETAEMICEHYPPRVIHSLMNHIGTHDTARAITRLGRSASPQLRPGERDAGRISAEEYALGTAKLRLAGVLQYTLPGVPSIYYGDEAGLTGGDDPYNRGCYPWGTEDAALIEHYRALARLRSSSKAFKNGGFAPVSAALGCIAFERNAKNESVLIIANANEHEIEYRVPERWRGAESIFGSAVDGDAVRLPAYSASVFKRSLDTEE